jgi:uncharacterized membrane protein
MFTGVNVVSWLLISVFVSGHGLSDSQSFVVVFFMMFGLRFLGFVHLDLGFWGFFSRCTLCDFFVSEPIS